VEELGPYTLSDCTALQNIYAAANSNYLRDIDGVLYSKDGSTLLRVPCGRSGELVIPEGVKSIADYAAFDCENLTLVTLPESVIHIGDHAFHQNTRITGSFEVDEAGVMYNGDATVTDGDAMVGRSFVRSLASRPDARELLARYIEASRRELCGDAPVLGRMKELLSYWCQERGWSSLWPVVKMCRNIRELELAVGRRQSSIQSKA
jgi:hypothetical protein